MFRFVTGFTYLAATVAAGSEDCRAQWGESFYHHIGNKCCIDWPGFDHGNCDLSWRDHNNCDNLGCAHGCLNNQDGETDVCTCRDGYRLADTGTTECYDVDECAEDNNSCETDITKGSCANKDPDSTGMKYECLCEDGYYLEHDKCYNINECTEIGVRAHMCDHSCEDTEGSYTCSCDDGFRLNEDGKGCTEINECAEETDTCDENAHCINHNPNSTGHMYKCTCLDGYDDNDETGEDAGKSCREVDECAEDRHDCHANADCTNTAGGYTCKCSTGYTGSGLTCSDIDECATGTDGCDAVATCTNTEGSHECACPEVGYTGDGYTCTDINECDTGDNDCHADAMCLNRPGAWDCICNPGYHGTGTECADRDECDEMPCHGNAACSNTIGSYHCDCNEGHQGAGIECTECSADSAWTEEGDHVTTMTAVCTCNSGFEGDGNTCDEIDECERGTDICDENAICANTVGSHTCTCIEGYYGLGDTCTSCHEEHTFDDMEVNCGADEIEVIIPYCAFYNEDIIEQSFLESGDNCIIENTGINMEMRIPTNSECGTKVATNGSYILYSNAIMGETRADDGFITRRKFLELEFECGFLADEDISFESSIHAMIDHVEVEMERIDKKFDVAMGVFTDDTFSEVVPDDFSIIVPEMINAGVSLMDGEDALVVMVEKCWATPTENSEDEISYVFIDAFCSTQEDGFLNIVKNGADKSSQFELQSFEFIDNLEGTLYLHCHAIVCDTEIESCDIDCSVARRRRRSSPSGTPKQSLRVGPIRVLTPAR